MIDWDLAGQFVLCGLIVAIVAFFVGLFAGRSTAE